MKNFKKLLVATSLVVILGGTALADCPAPAPHEINNPPCTSTTQQVTDDPTNQTTTATVTDTISTEVESVTLDAVVTGLENLLTVF
ncbi:MAG TPA: hypothetical protein VE863_02655 [Pyrinomonadaceae bacterium]|jgi:hypothetical protein|nr:hypothetical protein [Pyrinomonadaceae bacterium]